MAVMDDLFQYNFKQEMGKIKKRCRENLRRELNDLNVIFSDVDDGLYAYLMSNPFTGFDEVRAVIPSWASDEIRQDSTGAFSFHDHVLDATWFWRTVRDRFIKITGKKIEEARVADYGGGWGRVSRFANKDVPAKQLYVLEPNPLFRDIYKQCKLPGRLVEIDWDSNSNNGVQDIDLIFSYSIITHSSDRLTRNIVDRWAEMTNSGSIVAFTVRPGCYLAETDGDMSLFTKIEHKTLPSVYNSGSIVYKPYNGIENWGVTVASESYLENVFDGRFCIVDKSFQLQTMNQMIIFAQRI